MTPRHVTLFHAPNSRSQGALALLEELRADYSLHVLNLQSSEQRQPAYLAINPMGKVPAVQHGSTVITEQVAIFIYLADLYPEAGLAPAMDDPLRGSYLRWLVFYGSCFEPAIIDRSMNREAGPVGSSPYGDYDTTLKTILAPVERGPWILGAKFSAADVLWGRAFDWMLRFQLVPSTPALSEYIERVSKRPALVRARTRDDELAKAQAAVAASVTSKS
jgi:glutathione S-transferase